MKAQRPLTPLVESTMPVYMTGMAVGTGTGCGILAILILLGVLNI
jgi:hypothetical protein